MDEKQFQGFGKKAIQFFIDLSENNNREWFQENKHIYDKEILHPAELFVSALGQKLKKIYPQINYGTQKNGTGSIMRIYRDVRFSKDKRPFKENLGIVFWLGEGKKVEVPGFYFHIDLDNIFFYGGQHIFPKNILSNYRESMNKEETGKELLKVFEKLKKTGLPLMEEPAYKRVPQGYDSDHGREFYLRLGGIGVSSNIAVKEIWQASLVDLCLDYAKKMKPLMEWILKIQ